MDEALDRVEISGAALALILRELGSSRGDADGLLFGRVHTRSIQRFQDEGGFASTHQERTAIITGCCSSGTLMSFYDAAGSIDERKLTSWIGQRDKWGGDPLLGWLIGRRGCSMRPSMREAAVSANLTSSRILDLAPDSLQQHKSRENPAAVLGLPYGSGSSGSSSSSSIDKQAENGGGAVLPASLFLLLTQSTAENSVETLEYRTFEFHGATRRFHPRPLVVRNVGRASGVPEHGGGLYGGFVPVSPLPCFSTGSRSNKLDCSKGEEEEVDSKRSVRGREREFVKSSGRERPSLRQQQQQSLLNMYAEGFSIGQLEQVARGGGSVRDLELLYSRMLAKMQRVSEDVRQSSHAVEEMMRKMRPQLRGSDDRDSSQSF